MHTHTEKKVNRRRGEHCARVRGSPNQKKNQLTNETANEKNRNKVRKRKTMCETTHRKANKKLKRDPDQCNGEKIKYKYALWFM